MKTHEELIEAMLESAGGFPCVDVGENDAYERIVYGHYIKVNDDFRNRQFCTVLGHLQGRPWDHIIHTDQAGYTRWLLGIHGKREFERSDDAKPWGGRACWSFLPFSYFSCVMWFIRNFPDPHASSFTVLKVRDNDSDGMRLMRFQRLRQFAKCGVCGTRRFVKYGLVDISCGCEEDDREWGEGKESNEPLCRNPHCRLYYGYHDPDEAVGFARGVE